ncbi:MAG: hypothetical protein MUF54_10950 [Polyangiaceae bacterium]|jgi:hypothetical protein|nr:hypothetical protein [Polyangiaceae bacterium]
MVPRNKWLLAGAVFVVAVASWIIVDLLVVTDEERLEEFAEIVTEVIDEEHLRAALQHVDPSRQPVLVEARGQSARFDTLSQEQFATHARARLRPFEGLGQHALRREIELKENHAVVLTETFSRRGRVTVDWELRKHGNDWLVSRVNVR